MTPAEIDAVAIGRSLGRHMCGEVPRDGLIPERFEVTGIPEHIITITVWEKDGEYWFSAHFAGFPTSPSSEQSARAGIQYKSRDEVLAVIRAYLHAYYLTD